MTVNQAWTDTSKGNPPQQQVVSSYEIQVPSLFELLNRAQQQQGQLHARTTQREAQAQAQALPPQFSDEFLSLHDGMGATREHSSGLLSSILDEALYLVDTMEVDAWPETATTSSSSSHSRVATITTTATTTIGPAADAFRQLRQ